MLGVLLILIVVLAVSLYSEIHALGFLLLMMVAHNFIAGFLGGSAEHLPLFAGLIILTTIIARNKWTGIPTSVLLLVISLFIVMTAAAIAGDDPARSLAKVLLYSKGFVLAILIAGTVKTEVQVRCLTIYGLTGVLIAVCVTFIEHYTGAYVIEGGGSQRAGRFTGNPNDTAQLLLIGFPFVLYWATHSKSLIRTIAHYGLLGLVVGAITLTQSRGGFVSLLLLLFFLYIKRPSIKASVIGLVILGAGILLASPDSYFWDRMGTLVGKQETRDASIDARKHYVKTGVIIVLERPGLGVGMGNFGRAMIAVDPTYRETDENRVAHNMYLEFFVENGILGGLLFMTLLGIAAIQGIRYNKRIQSEHSAYGLGFCVAMSLIALLISGLFHSSGQSAVLWFLIGLGVAFQVMLKAAEKSSASQYTDNLAGY